MFTSEDSGRNAIWIILQMGSNHHLVSASVQASRYIWNILNFNSGVTLLRTHVTVS